MLRSFTFLFFGIICSKSPAFTLIGSAGNKGFSVPDITIQINQSSCPNSISLRRLVEDSVKAWNGISTSNLNLQVGGDTTATGATMPPTAYCDSSITGSTLGQGGHSLGSDGHIAVGFLRLNTNSSSAGYILNQNEVQQMVVVAHELGHMFGLGHTDKEFSLMHYSIGSKTELGLSQDDIDGASYLYPRNELGKDKILGGCGIISSRQQKPPVSGIWILLCIPLIFWFSLRNCKTLLT